jgi:hypothetical protein
MTKLSGIIILLLCSLFLAVVSSCSRVQYVPVESVRTDSVKILQQIRDSIYVHDSIFVKSQGDTVYINRYRYKYLDKVRIDTMYVIHVDSVCVPYPVERKLNRWERAKQEVGGIAIGVLITSIGLIITRFIIRRFGKR